MNNWRYVPRKPWHFIKDHEESMQCIRLIIKKQNEVRNRKGCNKSRKATGKKKVVFDYSTGYQGGALDISSED